jgi:RNA polymerase sigma factor (sigma-70 family)
MTQPIPTTLARIIGEIAAGARRDESFGPALLARYVASRDEDAFRDLVRLYAPLVWGVCRRCLRDPNDAEDALQATFIVLARKATRIVPPDRLSAWLHGVAVHAAREVREEGERRQKDRGAARPEHTTEPDFSEPELREVLDEELIRLPDELRQAFVLCRIEGRTYGEAARVLGCANSTVYERVVRATELLRQRLGRRGLAPAGALAGVTATDVPATIVERVVSGALGGPSTSAVAIADAVIRGMASSSLWRYLAVVVFLMAGVGGGIVLSQSLATPVPDAPASVRRAAPAPPAAPAPTVVISGQVFDEAGKPVPHARVVVLVTGMSRPGCPEYSDRLLGKGETNAEGEYRLKVPADFATGLPGVDLVKLLVQAPGFSLKTSQTMLAVDQSISVQLEAVSRLRGRLLTPDGRPAAGVRVGVIQIGWVRWQEEGTEIASPPGWPQSVVTDKDGWYEIAGLDGKEAVRVLVEDDRYGICTFLIPPGRTPSVVTLFPPRELCGRVVDKRTGQPLADIQVGAQPLLDDGLVHHCPRSRTDRDGRFRLRLQPKLRYGMVAEVLDDRSYLGARRLCPEGDKEVTLELTTGVRVTGRVANPDGTPIGKVWIQYQPREANETSSPSNMTGTVTGADGTFALTVAPGRGNLILTSGNGEYRVVVKSQETLLGQPGNHGRVYANAIVPLATEAGQPPRKVTVTLHKGTTVTGTVEDAEGRPVTHGVLLSHHLFWPLEPGARGILIASDGRFHLPGCEPGRTERVVVLDSKGEYGTVAELAPSTEKDRPTKVRLQPCGLAVARIENQKGQPISGYGIKLALRMPECSPPLGGGGTPEYQHAYWLNAALYPSPSASFRTNAKGEVVLRGLVPGVGYRLLNEAGRKLMQEDISVTPGERTLLRAILNTP